MAKSLIIAEKPSVAADIARALGGFARQGDYFESDKYVLCSAVGHLVEIAAPQEYEVKRGKWSFANLPVIPPHFDLHPIAKNQERLKLLARLIRRKDIDRLINACDAGREGELIFRLIVQHAKGRQPIERLWLQSMTQKSIRDAFDALRPDDEVVPLADAARCRSEADWLVGINGTRAMTAFNSRDGGFYLTTVGRVQTPTLAIVVDREERIRQFRSRDYFEVRATFRAKAGAYEGRWFDPAFRKGDDADARAERLWERARADAIVAQCEGRVGTVEEESRTSTQISPLLFDLTSLQREGNGRFGYSAKTTLSIAQALYEKHKAITYPRTDSRALPEDYLPTVSDTLGRLKADKAYGAFAARILGAGWAKLNKRVFDNTKVSDHFAIIPTVQPPRNLSDAEQRIYDLIVRRFLAVFFPPAEYLVTTRITTVEHHPFKTEGKILVDPGWLAIYGKGEAAGAPERSSAQGNSEGKDGADLIAVEPGELVRALEVAALALATRPPPRYNEATLLSAMEGAGKLIEDDELREAMAGKGLGTPATRAATIEGLISENYLIREGRELIPTTKAFQLLRLLRGLGVEELTRPELTGEWEFKLSQIEHGQLARDTFMGEIGEVTRRIVERAKNYQSDTVPGDYATLRTPCPNCGSEVQENYKRFACTSCEFSLSKHPGSREFEVAEVEQLVRERTIGPLQGFRSKMGRPFAAILKLNDENKLEFDFGQREGDDANAEAVDFSSQPSLGACPKCAARVFEHGMSYVCEKSVGPNKTCDFRTGKIILQQEVEPAQVRKLLDSGRTDLLTDFVSSRTRRKFKAFLVRDAKGKVGFEFEPRPARAAKGKKAASKDDAAPAVAAKKFVAKGAAAKKAAASKGAPKKVAPKKVAPNKAPSKKAASKKAAPKKP
ncbi:MAG: DNA topoisomerase III, partial [Burkholderiaceae bacterium]|nr:DNA topoisomerase III [Burkholderiaceae bacterium]